MANKKRNGAFPGSDLRGLWFSFHSISASISSVSEATPQSYIAAPLLNACIPSSVAISVYDSKVILSDFKALHFRVESSSWFSTQS